MRWIFRGFSCVNTGRPSRIRVSSAEAGEDSVCQGLRLTARGWSRPVPAHDGRADYEAGARIRRRVRRTAGCAGAGEGPVRRVRGLSAAAAGPRGSEVDGLGRRDGVARWKGGTGDNNGEGHEEGWRKYGEWVTMASTGAWSAGVHITRKNARGHLSSPDPPGARPHPEGVTHPVHAMMPPLSIPPNFAP